MITWKMKSYPFRKRRHVDWRNLLIWKRQNQRRYFLPLQEQLAETRRYWRHQLISVVSDGETKMVSMNRR